MVMFSPRIDGGGGIATVVRRYFDADLNKKVPLIFIPTTKDGSNSEKIVFFILALVKTLKAFSKRSNRIVHLHVSQDGSFFRKLIVFIVAKLFKKKVMIHIHGSNFQTFISRNCIIRWIAKKQFSLSDRVIVLSANTQAFIENFESRANVIKLYNPALSVENLRSSNRKGLKILFMGRLSQRKGTYDLLDVIREHKTYFTDKKVEFIIAGDGDLATSREIVNNNGLGEIVQIPGWVSGNEKHDLLKSADIYILPSYKEQMPMSILEAMAYGLPIISTFVAGIPEMVEDQINGILLNPGDNKALMTSLARLIEESKLRESMGKESLRIVKHQFDSAEIVSQLISIYENL